MLQNKQTLQAALEEKFGNAAFNFTEKNGTGSFFINPSSQTAIFNFLVYEEQWKYDVLKDVNLLYEPDHPVSEYVLVYNVASKLHKTDYYIHLPVAFSNGKANSLSHLYKTADKFEQIVTEVYDISFVSKKVKLEDFTAPNAGATKELVTAEVSPADFNEDFVSLPTPDRKPEKTIASPVAKTKKDIASAAKVITTNVGNFAESLIPSQKKENKERGFSFTSGKLLTALPSYKLPEETRFKVLYYLTPLVVAAAIFLFIRFSNQSKDENTGLAASSPAFTDNGKQASSSSDQSDYNVILPTGGNGKSEKTVVNTAAVTTKELQQKEKEKDKEKKKQEAIVNSNSNTGLPLLSQQPATVFTPNGEIAPVSFVATDKESKSFAPVTNNQEVVNIKTPPVSQQLTPEKKEEATVVSSATQKPEFPGGAAAMSKYLRRKLQMPDDAVDNNVDGNVVVRFMVDAKGNISNVELSKKIGYGCDEVVERAIQTMPKWIPGKVNGSVESMQVKLSVKFLVKGNQPTP
jgi:hypothetical protein